MNGPTPLTYKSPQKCTRITKDESILCLLCFFVACFHQTRTRSFGSRYIFASALTENASYQRSILRTVAVLYWSGAGPFVRVWLRNAASRIFSRQLWPKLTKNR